MPHDPHRLINPPIADDVGPFVTVVSRAYTRASQDSSLANELLRSTVWPNVLVIGPTPRVEAMLSTIVAALLTPVCTWSPEVPLAPLASECTVVVRDVATLRLDRQLALLAWLNEPSRRTQIIATSSIEIFPLVTRGLFLEALYYRLNTVLLDVGKSGQAARGSDGRRHSPLR